MGLALGRSCADEGGGVYGGAPYGLQAPGDPFRLVEASLTLFVSMERNGHSIIALREIALDGH